LEVWDPTQPELLWEINYYGVGRVVERYAGIADVVNGSTINVYGNRPTAPDEGAFCRPTTEYGLSRLAQEKLIDYFCMRGGTKGIHVRYAHANSAQRGVIHYMAECIVRGVSLGSKPDAFIQVIALEDFVRVTKEAVERLDAPPIAVNCCHPRVWTYRELAERIREELGRGEVVFDRESGGVEDSAYADVGRMLDWFGEPLVSLERMIQRVVDGFQ
jgi:nucleoside-diphosphate-sugar epimerase